MDRVSLLGSISIFTGLSPEDLQALACRCAERRYSAGQMIFNQGDQSDAMYIVADGHVNIHLPGEGSRRISLKDISRGEFFGELSLFDDQPRSASVLATTDVDLLELSRKTLSDYMENRPRAAMAVLRTMAGRLRQTNEILSARAARNVVEEVEKSLTWKEHLADKVAEFNGSWSFIIGLLLLTVGWTVFNAMPRWGQHFDPYPYQFYNLILGIFVGLQGPLIMMSQNRQSVKDRMRAENDFKVNLKNEVNIETLLRELGEFRAEATAKLERLEQGVDATGGGATKAST